MDIPGMIENCLYSFCRVFGGVLLAIIGGISLGIIRYSLPEKIKNNKLVVFILEAPKFIPPIAWIPFVILQFGIGNTSAATIVFIGAISPIFTNTYEGAEAVPFIIRNMAKSMELTWWEYHWKIIFAASLPKIFTGIRVGVGMGWMSVIAAEMVSGQHGLGYSIQVNRMNLAHTGVLEDMIMISIIGYFLYRLVLWTEKKFAPWQERFLPVGTGKEGE